MIKVYSVSVNSDMSEIEKYNLSRTWLMKVLEYCRSKQTYKDYNFKWESKICAKFTLKESIISGA